jgi:hypothetical protein
MDRKFTPKSCFTLLQPAHLSMHRMQIVTDPFFICQAQLPESGKG